jgi:hypothetical protein
MLKLGRIHIAVPEVMVTISGHPGSVPGTMILIINGGMSACLGMDL